MKKFRIQIFILTTFLFACTHLQHNMTLYERIGGNEKLSLVVSEFVDNITTNPKTSRSFKGVKSAYLKKSITNQLCLISGGNCIYDGETMKNSHADAKITTAEFELTVQALRDALDHQHVGTAEKNELLALLAPMKRDIVSN